MISARKIHYLFNKYAMLLMTLSISCIVIMMVWGLYYKSQVILSTVPWMDLVFSSGWAPFKGQFGFFPFIMGTLWVTMVGLCISVPVSLLTAIFLSEYCGAKCRNCVLPLIDVLAGIPSVVYGIWGILVVIPLVKNHLAPFFGAASTGYCVLSGGIVVAVMVLPFIVNVLIEVFQAIPEPMREASYALGATRWETVKHVVLRKAMPGIVAVIMLGLARALGETMAVLMVVGNVPKAPTSLFSPAYPLPALIANNYGELLSVPLYDSALLFAAFLLLIVVLFFNMASRFILMKLEKE